MDCFLNLKACEIRLIIICRSWKTYHSSQYQTLRKEQGWSNFGNSFLSLSKCIWYSVKNEDSEPLSQRTSGSWRFDSKIGNLTIKSSAPTRDCFLTQELTHLTSPFSTESLIITKRVMFLRIRRIPSKRSSVEMFFSLWIHAPVLRKYKPSQLHSSSVKLQSEK